MEMWCVPPNDSEVQLSRYTLPRASIFTVACSFTTPPPPYLSEQLQQLRVGGGDDSGENLDFRDADFRDM